MAFDADPFADLPTDDVDPFNDPFNELPNETRKGGVRSEVKPYVAGVAEDTRREDGSTPLPKGVKESGVLGGRGNVIPPTAAQMKRDEQAAKPRSWKQAAGDFTVALAKGGNSLMSLPVALVAPGGKAYDWLKENGEALQAMESPTLQAQRAQIADKLRQQPDEMAKFVTSLSESISNPAVAFSTVVEQLPIMGALLATGGVAGGVAGAAVAPIGSRAIVAAAQRVGAGAGMAAGGAVGASGDAASSTFDRLMNAEQTPDELLEQNADYNAMIVRGATPAEARKAIASSKSKLAAALAAPLGAVSGLVGLKAPGMRVETGGVLTGARATATELGGELGEELGTQGASNVAVQTIDPSQSLTEGFGETAAQTVIGAAGPSVLAGLQRGKSDDARLGEALAGDIADAEFQRAPIDEFARRAMSPSFYDPNTVVPGMPQPVTAEQMPADRVVTPEELSAEMAQADAVKTVQQVAAAQAEAAPVAAEAPQPAPAQGEKIGVANVPQGKLAGEVDALLRGRAVDAGSSGLPGSGAGAGGAQRAPDAGAGVVSAGRAADAPQRQVAGTDAPAGAAPVAGGNANRGNASGVASLQAKYSSKREAFEQQAAKAERGAREMEAVGMKDQAANLSARATKLRYEASRFPVVNEPQAGPALDQANAFFDALEAVTGHRPVAYEGNGQLDGFSDDGVTAVDISRPDMPVPFTIFHEFAHEMQNRAKTGDAAAKRAEAAMGKVWEMISPEGKKTYAEKYLFKAEAKAKGVTVEQLLADPKKLEVLRREMLADFMGKRATDKRFLKKLAKRDPENFGDFVRQWVDMLGKLIAELKGKRQSGVKDVDQWIAQLEAAKSAAEEAMVEWAKSNQAPAEPAVSASQRNSRDPSEPDLPPLDFDFDDKPGKEPTGPGSSEMGGFNLDANDEDMSLEWDDDPKADLQAELEAEQAIPAGEATELPPIDTDMLTRELSRSDMNALASELASEGYGVNVRRYSSAEKSQPRLTTDFTQTSDEQLKAAGLMAESAYPSVQYTPIGYDLVATVKIDGQPLDVRVTPTEQRQREGTAFGYPQAALTRVTKNAPGQLVSNFDKGNRQLSTEQAKKLAGIYAASIDLYARGYDLSKALPAPVLKRVVSGWRDIAKMSGAFEFGTMPESLVGPKKSGERIAARAQEIADALMEGTEYEVKATPSDAYGASSIDLWMATKDGEKEGKATIQYVFATPEQHAHFVMHCEDLAVGSGMGKAFYQIAFGLADALGDIPVEADGILLGVNNYRRTEQMMSAAARSGKASVVRPGVGQRLYGWNRKAKSDKDGDANFARIVLAAARNAAEFVPEIKDIRYDLASDAFTWRNGSDAEAFIKGVLSKDDLRLVSMSRSTLARAAITFAAIDNELDLSGVDEVASPVLYSARAEPEYADSTNALGEGYSRLDGRKVKYQVRVADTGDIATLSVDARAAMSDLDSRLDTMRKLISCLGR